MNKPQDLSLMTVFRQAYRWLVAQPIPFLFFTLLANIFALVQAWNVSEKSSLFLQVWHHFRWRSFLSLSYWLQNIGIGVIWLIGFAALLLFLLAYEKGEQASLENALFETFLLLPKLLMSLLLFAAAVAIGILFVVGWLIVLAAFWLYLPALLKYRGDMAEAGKEVLSLLKGRLFFILSRAFLFFWISLLLQLPFLFLPFPLASLRFFVEMFFSALVTLSFYQSLCAAPQVSPNA